jgi:hypothetical protein
MLAITHLAVSLLLIHLLMLDRNDSFVALTFGVLIDIDHLFGLKEYIGAQGISGVLDFDSLMNADGQWKSMLHTPAAAMVVGPVATASRLALPLLFWGLHISMDFVEDMFLGLFSGYEMLFLSASVFALLWLRYRKTRISEPELDLAGFVSYEVRRLGSAGAGLMRRVLRSRGQ